MSNKQQHTTKKGPGKYHKDGTFRNGKQFHAKGQLREKLLTEVDRVMLREKLRVSMPAGFKLALAALRHKVGGSLQ